jgi:RHS repeat-associated protein
LPSSGAIERTLYVGAYEEQWPINQTIAWTSVVNSSGSSPAYSLKKTGTNSAWDAGAISTQSIASGDGYVSVVADATNTERMFGLGNSNQSASSSDIEYGLKLKSDGTLEIIQEGSSAGSYGSYVVGDVLKVAVVSGAVKYYRNDTLLYTNNGRSPSYPLYLDTSLYTPGSVLAGALLCAGSVCTSAPEYTTYYSFGGMMVGMRRANASAGNGQFRIVGDHLGSTTLIVDTATPPNVVQRQYHESYGETTWQYTATSTGGESLTNVAYTGQRTDEDSTGLLFYNARMYDPALSFFISADTIAADAGELGSRNRYSYVLYNPVKLTDPSGHSPDEQIREGEGN